MPPADSLEAVIVKVPEECFAEYQRLFQQPLIFLIFSIVIQQDYSSLKVLLEFLEYFFVL